MFANVLLAKSSQICFLHDDIMKDKVFVNDNTNKQQPKADVMVGVEKYILRRTKWYVSNYRV